MNIKKRKPGAFLLLKIFIVFNCLTVLGSFAGYFTPESVWDSLLGTTIGWMTMLYISIHISVIIWLITLEKRRSKTLVYIFPISLMIVTIIISVIKFNYNYNVKDMDLGNVIITIIFSIYIMTSKKIKTFTSKDN